MDKPEPKEATLDNLLKIFWLKKKLISLLVVAALAVITVYSFIMPVAFEAEGSILPPEESSGGGGLSGFLQSVAGNISLGGMGQSNKTQIISEFVRSRELALYIIKKLDLAGHPFFKDLSGEQLCRTVMKSIDASVNRSGLTAVSSRVKTSYFPSSDDRDLAAKLSADLINTAIEGVDYLFRQKNTSKAKQKKLFIEKMLVQKKRELDSVDQMIESFQKNNQVLEIESQTSAIMSNAVNLGAELSKAEIELQMKLQEFNANSPAVAPYRQQVETLRRQYRMSQRGGLVKNDDFSIPLTEVPKLIREYRMLVRDQKILEQVNLYLETQNYQEAIQEASDVTAIEALDRASVPEYCASPNRKMMLIIGFFLSFAGSLLIVTLQAYFKGRIYFRKSIQE